MPLILCQPRAPVRKVYDTASRLSCIPGFRRVRACGRKNARHVSVVKSEGDYEFQMAKEEAKAKPMTAQPPPGARLGAVPASKPRALAA
jgi:hypothetical protein